MWKRQYCIADFAIKVGQLKFSINRLVGTGEGRHVTIGTVPGSAELVSTADMIRKDIVSLAKYMFCRPLADMCLK